MNWIWIKFLFICKLIFVNISLFDNCRIQFWSSIWRLEQYCSGKIPHSGKYLHIMHIYWNVFSKDMIQLESQDKLGWKGLLEFSLWSKQGQLLMNLSSWVLNSSKDGHFMASFSNTFQCLTTLSINFFLFYPVRIALAETWLLLLSFHSTLLRKVWLYYFFIP